MRQTRMIIVVGVAAVLAGVLLTWRLGGLNGARPTSSWTPFSSVIPTPQAAATGATERSPLPIVPTVLPPINPATLEAIRTVRPTATPPAHTGIELPYISPDIWRTWALRLLAAAGFLAYVGLRLRSRQ